MLGCAIGWLLAAGLMPLAPEGAATALLFAGMAGVMLPEFPGSVHYTGSVHPSTNAQAAASSTLRSPRISRRLFVSGLARRHPPDRRTALTLRSSRATPSNVRRPLRAHAASLAHMRARATSPTNAQNILPSAAASECVRMRRMSRWFFRSSKDFSTVPRLR